jgi:hypothetical protein
MLRKAFVILALILPSIIVVGPAQGSDLILKNPVRISDQQTPTILSSQKTLKSRNRLMQSPGTIIDSTYYDWQRNGSMDDHLQVFDDGGTIKINGIMMIAYLEDTSDRTIAYYHWDGLDWMGHGMQVFPVRNAYGSMSQFDDGRVALCTHGDFDAGGTRCYAAYDASPGSYTFSYYGTDPSKPSIWPRISVNSDGSVTMTGTSQATSDVSVARAPDGWSKFGTWTNLRTWIPNWMDNDMELPTVHSGTNGKVGIAIPDIAGAMRMLESTDNGNTWSVITIAPAETLYAPAGLDSTAARASWIGADLMYIGEEPHVVWSAGQIANVGGGNYGIYDFKSEILHWSPSTGVSTVVVAEYQSADPTRTDYVIPADNHLSVDFASLGVATDGITLVCAYTAFDPADADPTSIPADYAFGDIWVASSSNNGATWSEPINVTNPDGSILGWDDLYPSLARTNIDNAADPGKDVYMIYQSDDLAGTFVQGTEGSLNMDYIKFVGIDLAAVGIGDGGDQGYGTNMPKVSALSQNYPNPFNPSTTISFDIPGTAGNKQSVSLTVYDIRGRRVKMLIDSELDPGSYKIHWDGRNDRGVTVSSGIYLYTLKAGDETFTRKMTILK